MRNLFSQVLSSHIREAGKRHVRLVLAVIILGTAFRIVYWEIYPPNWRLHAVFTPLDMSILEYISDFQGYKPARFPFFDIFAAGVYLVLRPLLDQKAYTAFPVLLGVFSLPLFYGATRRLFDRQVALYGLLLYAFYPQSLVLTAEGYPEVTSVAFAVTSIYCVARGLESDRNGWYLLGGIAGTLSYLMFLPGVAFAVVTNAYVYFQHVEKTSYRELLPDPPSVIYAVPPGIMGIGYLVFGQVGSVVSRGYSNEQITNYIFTTDTYSTIERVVRYVAYTHFDFWWHTPGFDHERHIMQLLSGLEVFFGQLFPIYLGGWIAITTTLAGIIIAGITVLVRRRDLTASYVLVWLGVYALLWNAKNLNWSGGFNTRHVHTVVPALCLAFGVGAAWLVARINKEQISSRIPDWQATRPTALVVMISVLFVILMVNGAVQGTVRAEKNSISYEKPIEQLASIADDGDTVAVTQRRSCDYTLIYTHGDIRPVILLAENQTRHHETRTVLADIQVVDPSHIYQTDIDYLLVNNFQCRDITARERAIIDNATLNGGEVVHHEVVNRPRFRCSEFETYIVRIGST